MKKGSSVQLIANYESNTIAFFQQHGLPIPKKDITYTVSRIVDNASSQFYQGIVLQQYSDDLVFNQQDWQEIDSLEQLNQGILQNGYSMTV